MQTSSGEINLLNSNFNPYDVLQQHEQTINRLIKSHNEVAQIVESLAENNMQLSNRLNDVEDELNRLYNYIGENIS